MPRCLRLFYERTCAYLLSRLDGVREGADWRVFANLQKALALMFLESSSMHAEALAATASRMIDAMCEELFE